MGLDLSSNGVKANIPQAASTPAVSNIYVLRIHFILMPLIYASLCIRVMLINKPGFHLQCNLLTQSIGHYINFVYYYCCCFCFLLLFVSLMTLQDSQVAQRYTSTGQHQLAPTSGNSVGIARAEIKQGVREIILCKDQNGKMGLRLRSVNKVGHKY